MLLVLLLLATTAAVAGDNPEVPTHPSGSGSLPTSPWVPEASPFGPKMPSARSDTAPGDEDASSSNPNRVDDEFRDRLHAFYEFFEEASWEEEEDDWATSTGHMMTYMQCDEKDDDDRLQDAEAYTAIPTVADYSLLVEAYLWAMDKNRDDAWWAPSVTAYTPGIFEAPVEVRSTPYVGRGVFATEDIPKGALVVAKPKNEIEFYSREIYRDFVAYSHAKRSNIICDSMIWMYGALKTPEFDYIICLDADDSSLVNSGEWHLEEEKEEVENDDEEEEKVEEEKVEEEEEDDDEDEEDDDDDEDEDGETEETNEAAAVQRELKEGSKINIGQYIYSRTIYGCQDPPMYALRDIKAGEELLMSYDDFSYPEAFWEMGYLHSR